MEEERGVPPTYCQIPNFHLSVAGDNPLGGGGGAKRTLLRTTMTKLTSLNVEQRHLEAIDAAQTELFGTDAVARRAVVERLLRDHPDVKYGH